jgi:hypothetical protein
VYVCVFLFVFQYIEQRVALTHYLTCSLPLENTHALTIALNSPTSSLVQLTQERPQQTTIRESHSVHENSIATTESNTEFNLLRGWVAAEQFIEQQTEEKHITTEAHLFTGAHLWYVQFRCIRLSPGREGTQVHRGRHTHEMQEIIRYVSHTHSLSHNSLTCTHSYVHTRTHTHTRTRVHSFVHPTHHSPSHLSITSPTSHPTASHFSHHLIPPHPTLPHFSHREVLLQDVYLSVRISELVESPKSTTFACVVD